MEPGLTTLTLTDDAKTGTVPLPVVAAAGEAAGRVVAAARLAQLRHDGALVDGLGLIGDGVDVLARLVAAQRRVLGRRLTMETVNLDNVVENYSRIQRRCQLQP